MRSRRSFAADVAAQSPVEVVGILAVVVVPLALFALLLVYLRRTVAQSGQPGPATVPPPPEPENLVRGARPCARCGVRVRPVRGAYGTECPNCGAGMA